MQDVVSLLWLIPVGLIAGALGTFVGAGGGFLVVPVLLIAYPGFGPETITAVSLAIIFLNSTSGSLRYARTRRIDYKSGLMFAVATIPGAAVGAYLSDMIPRALFNLVFGLFMVAVSVLLMVKPGRPKSGSGGTRPGHYRRRFTDAKGETWDYSFSRGTGVGISTFVGLLSSVLGIGGGIIHVPVMSRLLNFPVHIATATSQFVLAISSLTGVTVHLVRGEYFSAEVLNCLVLLAAGVIPGAQIGARFSEKVDSRWIVRVLGVVIIIVAARLFAAAAASLAPDLGGK